MHEQKAISVAYELGHLLNLSTCLIGITDLPRLLQTIANKAALAMHVDAHPPCQYAAI